MTEFLAKIFQFIDENAQLVNANSFYENSDSVETNFAKYQAYNNVLEAIKKSGKKEIFNTVFSTKY